MAPTFFFSSELLASPGGDGVLLVEVLLDVVGAFERINFRLLVSLVSSPGRVTVVVIKSPPIAWPAYVKAAFAMESGPGDGKHIKSRTPFG
jgi:hypothetical protein